MLSRVQPIVTTPAPSQAPASRQQTAKNNSLRRHISYQDFPPGEGSLPIMQGRINPTSSSESRTAKGKSSLLRPAPRAQGPGSPACLCRARTSQHIEQNGVGLSLADQKVPPNSWFPENKKLSFGAPPPEKGYSQNKSTSIPLNLTSRKVPNQRRWWDSIQPSAPAPACVWLADGMLLPNDILGIDYHHCNTCTSSRGVRNQG